MNLSLPWSFPSHFSRLWGKREHLLRLWVVGDRHMDRVRKILIMGLPGAGKTTLAKILVHMLGAAHFNADEVRKELTSHLGFSLKDRIEQAHTMGRLCDEAVLSGRYAIADFVCPTQETRAAFGADDAFVIWVDRIRSGRYEDTNCLFLPPEKYDVRVSDKGDAKTWARKIYDLIQQTASQDQSSQFVRKDSVIKQKGINSSLLHLTR